MDSFFHGQTCAECAVNLFKKVKDYEKFFCIHNFLYGITYNSEQTDGKGKPAAE